MKKIVYVLGNPVEEKDNAAVKVAENLKSIMPYVNFVHIDPTEETDVEDGAVILDTILGIKKVTVFDDLESFEVSPRNSVHDFDLRLYLGILLKLGKIKSFTIIGIPEKYPENKASGEVRKILGEIRNI